MMPPASHAAAGKLERRGGVPGRLSVRALRYAAALPPLSATVFADRLYRYYTLPRTSLAGVRRDRHRLTGRGSWRTVAGTDWPWLSLAREKRATGRWKLYLSPAPNELYECARRALPVLTANGAVFMKLGRDDGTILRPDRFLAYFTEYATLMAAATELGVALSEFEGLGVPFTSPIGNGRLLSWGLDLSVGRNGVMSWRHWVTSELGIALFKHGQGRARRGDPVEFALSHLTDRGLKLSGFCAGPSLQRGLNARGTVR